MLTTSFMLDGLLYARTVFCLIYLMRENGVKLDPESIKATSTVRRLTYKRQSVDGRTLRFGKRYIWRQHASQLSIQPSRSLRSLSLDALTAFGLELAAGVG